MKLLFIFPIIMISISSVASSRVSVKKSLLLATAAFQLKTKPIYLESTPYKATESEEEIIFVHNKFECGAGTCSQIAFLKEKNSRYKYAGVIEGRVDKVDWDKQQIPVVTTTLKIDTENSESAVWKYNMKSQVYESQ